LSVYVMLTVRKLGSR